MTINLQTGAYNVPQSLPGTRSADTQVAQKQQSIDPITAPAPLPEQATPSDGTEASGDDARIAAIKNLFKDIYVVSDTSFTIFKDASGEFITRYTSLRDGRVTYVPEPKLLQLFESSIKPRATTVTMQA